MSWWQELPIKFKTGEPLKGHTTFKIGGPAQFFFTPDDISELQCLVRILKRNRIRLRILGGGSNLLVRDRSIRGAVIKLSAPAFKKTLANKNRVEAGSGIPLGELLSFCQRHRLSGLEFLAGIPGTLGGALIMNAGAYGRSIGDLVESVTIMDYNSALKQKRKESLRFGYRCSNLSGGVVVKAVLKLRKDDPVRIAARRKQYLAQRRLTQSGAWASAGCVFKNPKGLSAGLLIERCGLKGMRIGRACVSDKHANFIINKGNAKAGDVLKLMALIKRKAKRRFNITLEPEIKIW